MQTGRSETPFMDRLRAPEAAPAWSFNTTLFFIAAYGVLWIAALTIVSILAGDITGYLSERTKIYAGLLHGIVISVVVLQWAAQRLPNGLADLKLGQIKGRDLFITFMIGFGVAITIDLIGRLLRLTGGVFIPPLFEALKLDPNESISLVWILAALYALFVQPFAEALIFAGIVYPSFRQRLRDNLVAIAFVGVVFALVNVIIAVQQETWFVIIQPLLMGAFIAGVRAFSKSTRLAIAARVGFGLWIVLSALFSIRFGT